MERTGALKDFGTATREEIQRAHDILHAMVAGELPCPLMPENLRLLHAVHDALSWVLGFPCGEHFRLTMTGIVQVLSAEGVQEWPNHPQASSQKH